jgi:hypothetical protein
MFKKVLRACRSAAAAIDEVMTVGSLRGKVGYPSLLPVGHEQWTTAVMLLVTGDRLPRSYELQGLRTCDS